MAQTMLIEWLPFTHILKCNIFGESNRFLENGIQCPQLLRVQALATVLMVPVESTGTGLNELRRVVLGSQLCVAVVAEKQIP